MPSLSHYIHAIQSCTGQVPVRTSQMVWLHFRNLSVKPIHIHYARCKHRTNINEPGNCTRLRTCAGDTRPILHSWACSTYGSSGSPNVYIGRSGSPITVPACCVRVAESPEAPYPPPSDWDGTDGEACGGGRTTWAGGGGSRPMGFWFFGTAIWPWSASFTRIVLRRFSPAWFGPS